MNRRKEAGALRVYLRTVQEFSRAQIWCIILVAFAAGCALGLMVGWEAS